MNNVCLLGLLSADSVDITDVAEPSTSDQVMGDSAVNVNVLSSQAVSDEFEEDSDSERLSGADAGLIYIL